MMKRRDYLPRFSRLRRLCLLCGLFAGLAIIAGGFPGAGRSPAGAQGPPGPHGAAFATSLRYVETFYPRWFTYEQSEKGTVRNSLVGPDLISPLYHSVVAINDDTLYVSAFVDRTREPAVLTIPDPTIVTPTGTVTVTFSLLTLDVYGDIFETGIPNTKGGIYGLTAPGWTGTLPPGVTRIDVQDAFTVFIFRVDKFSPSGQDQRAEAELFRSSLHLAKLSEYVQDPLAGQASIVPVVPKFAIPFKGIADGLIANDAIEFLQRLQEAVESPSTPPLSRSEQLLADTFNRLFGDGTFNPDSRVDQARKSDFILGAQSAHSRIVNNYLTHTGRTNWITFTNIGNWGRNYVDRSSITEFCQYCNNHSTAAYFHAFKDGQGAPLDASTTSGYILTFSKKQIPQAERFWSVTAYTPDAIELVENPDNKYVVASYTPGLVKGPDGSISIYMFPQRPPGVPEANWLPVPRGPFNVMLRVYGPEGSVARNTYVPPGITVAR